MRHPPSRARSAPAPGAGPDPAPAPATVTPATLPPATSHPATFPQAPVHTAAPATFTPTPATFTPAPATFAPAPATFAPAPAPAPAPVPFAPVSITVLRLRVFLRLNDIYDPSQRVDRLHCSGSERVVAEGGGERGEHRARRLRNNVRNALRRREQPEQWRVIGGSGSVARNGGVGAKQLANFIVCAVALGGIAMRVRPWRDPDDDEDGRVERGICESVPRLAKSAESHEKLDVEDARAMQPQHDARLAERLERGLKVRVGREDA